MSGIEGNMMPLVSTIGFGGIAIRFALKRIMKILPVIAGVFFAALMYLESQHIVNVNWDKLQAISNSVLSTITATTTNAMQYNCCCIYLTNNNYHVGKPWYIFWYFIFILFCLTLETFVLLI